MNTGSVSLPFSVLRTLSPSTRAEIAEYLARQLADGFEDASENGADSDEPADLSVAQAKTFLERCSDKTRTALRVIAQSDPSGFAMSAVAEALGVDLDFGDLRGVWGGITKRTRTVLGDDSADLIWWHKEDDGSWTGWVSAMTHRSLGKALAL